MSESLGSGDFTFKKHERLSSKKLIDLLFSEGHSSKAFPISIKYLNTAKVADTQVLISVPKKKFKRAVDRNLLKRRVREAYRQNKKILQGAPGAPYLLGIIYISDEILSFREIENKLILVLNRLTQNNSSQIPPI